MSFGTVFSGFLKGFNETTAANRQAAAEERRLALERDSKILTALLDHDDPTIANSAAQGLIGINDAKYKPGRGLASFLGGDTPTNPDIDRILSSVRAFDAVPTTQAEVNDTQAQSVMAHPGAASMAPPPSTGAGPQPSQMQPPPQPLPGLATPPPKPIGADAPRALDVPVTPGADAFAAGIGAPPPNPQQLLAMIKSPTSRPGVRPPSTTTRIFQTTDERIRRAAVARAQGDTEGDIQAWISTGMSREQAMAQVQAERARGGSSGGAFSTMQQGQLSNGTLAWGRQNRLTGEVEVMDPNTGELVDAATLGGWRPRTASSSSSMGTMIEVAAGQLGYPNAAAARAAGPDAMARVTALANQLQHDRSYASTMGTGQANSRIPLSTGQRSARITELQDIWRKVDLKAKVMREQAGVMETALARAVADPPGASEAFRTAFITMFDPNATVREGDYARLGLGLSLMNRIEGFIQSVGSGGGNIPLPVMREMAETAKQVATRAQTWNQDEAARIDATAQMDGIDPGLIRGSLSATPPPAPAAAPGAAPAASPAATPPPATPAAGAANIPAAPAANAPRVGTVVGNDYTGQVRWDANGIPWGMVDGAVIQLRQDGARFLY